MKRPSGNRPCCCSPPLCASCLLAASTWQACCSLARGCGGARSQSGWRSVQGEAVSCGSCLPKPGDGRRRRRSAEPFSPGGASACSRTCRLQRSQAGETTISPLAVWARRRSIQPCCCSRWHVALSTPLLCALVPALSASRLDLVTALKEDNRGGGRRGRALSILVVTEVAIACLLLTAAGVLIENFARIQGRRTGFNSDDVLTFWVRPAGSRYPLASGPATVNRLLTSIQAVPGVESAAVNRCTPFSGCSRTVLFLPDRPIDPATAPTRWTPLRVRGLLPVSRHPHSGRPSAERRRSCRRSACGDRERIGGPPLLAWRISARQARLVRHDDRPVF